MKVALENSIIFLILILGHKVVLAARSEYFRALLFGGLSETNKTEIELPKTPLQAFKIILKYIYTGKINLKTMKTKLVLDVLELSNLYGFIELKAEISNYLKSSLNLENVCGILDASLLYSLEELTQSCFLFFDANAEEILKHETFKYLFKDSLIILLARDSFFAPEICIFEGVRGWIENNSDLSTQDIKKVVSTVRLPLIDLEDLLNVVRSSYLIDPDQVLDAIQVQVNQSKTQFIAHQLNYRGKVLMHENVSNIKHGAKIIQGISDGLSIIDDPHPYDIEKGYTRHTIKTPSDENAGIVIELSNIFIINHIKLHLWDHDMRSYSYAVELSVDKKHWERVVDYSNYLCRSWQFLFFEKRPVKYIRIVGTHNTSNRIFHLVSIESMLVKTIPLRRGHFIVPKHNVASLEKGAIVTEGVSRSKGSLLNGIVVGHDHDKGYTCHQLCNGNISIQLAQPYVIDSLRILLWDCDDRTYSFYIESSTNQTDWEMLVDKRNERLQSWQSFTFPPKLMR